MNYIYTHSEQREFIESETKQNLKESKEEKIDNNNINNFKDVQITQVQKKKKNNEINSVNINKIQLNINKKEKEKEDVYTNNTNNINLKLNKKNKYKIIKKQLSHWKSSFFSDTEKSEEKDNKFKNINETKSMDNSLNNNIYIDENYKNIDEIPEVIFSNNLKINNKFYTVDLNEQESNIDKDIKINIHPGPNKTLQRNCLSDRYGQNSCLRSKSLKED